MQQYNQLRVPLYTMAVAEMKRAQAALSDVAQNNTANTCKDDIDLLNVWN